MLMAADEIAISENQDEPRSAEVVRKMSMTGAAATSKEFSKNICNQKSLVYNPQLFKEADGSVVHNLTTAAMEQAMKRHEEHQGRQMLVAE